MDTARDITTTTTIYIQHQVWKQAKEVSLNLELIKFSRVENSRILIYSV